MKKRNSIVFIVLLAIAFVLTGCNNPNQIEKYYQKLKDADSATIVMEIDAPILGKVKMTMKFDGNKSYVSSLAGEGEKYRENIDNTTYTYTQNTYGQWIRSESPYEEEDAAAEELSGLFVSENYEYSKELEKFVLKDDVSSEVFDGMESESLTLEIDGDTCIIVGEVNNEGIVMPITITIKNLNSTTITLPEVEE